MPVRAPLLAALAACAAMLLAACGGGSPAASPVASERPVLTLDEVDAEPVELREEAVAVAFDQESAAELVTSLPAELDFGEHALVCVFLGPRQTTGWSLDLRTASLSGDELRIRARETAPRTETQPEVTYPADCALLSRDALPAGELRVWADDTVTDEFIAEAVIEVPPASAAP